MERDCVCDVCHLLSSLQLRMPPILLPIFTLCRAEAKIQTAEQKCKGGAECGLLCWRVQESWRDMQDQVDLPFMWLLPGECFLILHHQVENAESKKGQRNITHSFTHSPTYSTNVYWVLIVPKHQGWFWEFEDERYYPCLQGVSVWGERHLSL